MTLCLTTSSGQVSRSHKRSIKTGVAVHIPLDILKAPIVVQAVVRNKIFSSEISAVMYEIVATLEGDPLQFFQVMLLQSNIELQQFLKIGLLLQ